MTAARPMPSGGPWASRVSARALGALLLTIALPLPLHASVLDVDLANVIAQTVAVASIFLILPVEFSLDAVRPRPGSRMRLVVLFMALTAFTAWGSGLAERGVSLSALLSLLNWIALGGLVVCGQLLLADRRRLALAMNTWAVVQTVVAAAAVLYLVATFGAEVLSPVARSPLQHAVKAFLWSWPNDYGLTLVVAVCICYGQIHGGRRNPLLKAQLLVLFIGVLFTFSRNALLTTTLALVAVTFAAGASRRALLAFLGSLLFVVVLAVQVPIVKRLVSETVRPGSYLQLGLLQRVAFGAEALRIWSDRPLVGVGFGRFEEFASLARLTAEGPGYVPGSVHNEYLTTLFKGGLITVAGFLTFMVVAWRLMRRVATLPSTSDLRMWGAVGVGVIVALGVGGFGGECFRNLSISAPFWLLVGALSMLEARLPVAVGDIPALHEVA